MVIIYTIQKTARGGGAAARRDCSGRRRGGLGAVPRLGGGPAAPSRLLRGVGGGDSGSRAATAARLAQPLTSVIALPDLRLSPREQHNCHCQEGEVGALCPWLSGWGRTPVGLVRPPAHFAQKDHLEPCAIMIS
jgi:hypothetical protein